MTHVTLSFCWDGSCGHTGSTKPWRHAVGGSAMSPWSGWEVGLQSAHVLGRGKSCPEIPCAMRLHSGGLVGLHLFEESHESDFTSICLQTVLYDPHSKSNGAGLAGIRAVLSLMKDVFCTEHTESCPDVRKPWKTTKRLYL